ncbi:thiamine pyrophosphate-dependent acetolactate synthase large subunit-like protein [Amorphus suaedae]
MTVDIPVKRSKPEIAFGSDVAAEMLRRLGVDYVCINPGSSFRGLHDSLVNYLGNERPEMLLALHEESAVSIAHGYAKASGKPMAVVLHSNVGLMHGMMAVFNAWCDRVPILILGATGAVDTAVRRNWIDWMHTFRDQGAMVRSFVKWDDQPSSPAAMVDAIGRAYTMACTAPCGPSYVILDRRLQEDAIDVVPAMGDATHYRAPPTVVPSRETIDAAMRLLRDAKSPVILIGRVSRSREDWDRRVALAEALGARVITDLRTGASFPTGHPLHGDPPDLFLTGGNRDLLAAADVVLSLDWTDIADVMLQRNEQAGEQARLIQVSLDPYVHNGSSGDHQRRVSAEISLLVDPDACVMAMTEALPEQPSRGIESAPEATTRSDNNVAVPSSVPTLSDIGDALLHVRGEREICLARVPLNWPAGAYPFADPLDYLGYDGGGGVGSGPGMTIGAALALKDSGRLVVGMMGDGEFLGAPTALWTAAHYRVPVLFVVTNNRSYYTDEIQQEAVAVHRDRPPENKWIGQRIDEPAIDIAGVAADMGVKTEPAITEVGQLQAAFERGLAAVEAGEAYLLEISLDSSRGSSLDWLNHH